MFKTWDDAILRIGLLTSVALCWFDGSRLWETGNMIVDHISLSLSFINYFLAAVLLFMAVIQPIPRWARLLIPLTLFVMVGSLTYTSYVNRQQVGDVLTTDVHLFTDYAADLVRQGQNPYAYDLLDSFRVYRASQTYSTPLIDGDVTGGVSYPSLGFLLYVPFQILGISTTLVFPVMLLATFMALYAMAPRALRPLAVVPFLVNSEYTYYSAGGVNDIGWALLLCLMILAWKRFGWRAILFGLACAYKQQPWFLAPFLLVRIWYEAEEQPVRARIKRILQFSLIASGVFLIVNTPYMVGNFNAWVTGVLRPVADNMIVLGQGYSSLTLFGIVFFPHWFFSLFSYGLLIILLALYARWYRRWPEALWIIPAIVLWFGHRSLSSYWYYYLFPLLAALLMRYREYLPRPAPEEQPASRLWLIPVLISAAAVVGAIGFSIVANPIQMTLVQPVIFGGTDTRVTVEVANHSDQTLTPRFSIESWTEQPFFWNVINGPSTLAPGQQAVFTLATSYPPQLFNLSVGAEVIVNDANSYDLRAAAFLPAAAVVYPDRPPNGDYVYWTPKTNAPYGWGFVGNQQTGQISLKLPSAVGDPDHAVRLSLTPVGNQPSDLALDTWLMLPEAPIQLWVKPPAQSNQAPKFATLYGIQAIVTVNNQPFYILFGDSSTSGKLPTGEPYLMIHAPSDQWTQVSFNVAQIIQQLGVPLPDPEIRMISGLQIPMRMVNFRFYLRASTPTQADFGPISVQDTGIALADYLIAETIQSPADLLTWRGDINLQAGNAEIARQYYQQAIDTDPTSAAANYGLATALLRLGRYSDALSGAQTALDNAYPYSARLYITMGNANLGLKRYTDAQAAFAHALDHFGTDPISYDSTFQAQIYSGLGQALLFQNRPEVAEGMFAQSNQLNPLDLTTYQALIEIYTTEGRCDAAAAIHNQAAHYGLTLASTTCK
ncbi:MAG TPA: tetratricopeptide repeat protein [Phototrophicaceae bacterium]|nr:tetratricopeptide repeat protein [Phototrophicaceae bacterium]